MNKLLASAVALAVVLGVVANPLRAADQEKKKADPAAQFKKLDTNGDGKLSLEEFQARAKEAEQKAKMEKAFRKMDKDGDGSLTLDEYSSRGKK